MFVGIFFQSRSPRRTTRTRYKYPPHRRPTYTRATHTWSYMSCIAIIVGTALLANAGLCPPGMVYVVGVPPMYNDTYVTCTYPCQHNIDCNMTSHSFCGHSDIDSDSDSDGDISGMCATHCNRTSDCEGPDVCVSRNFGHCNVCMTTPSTTHPTRIAMGTRMTDA